jgi:lysophospholipase L1-like esterase
MPVKGLRYRSDDRTIGVSSPHPVSSGTDGTTGHQVSWQVGNGAARLHALTHAVAATSESGPTPYPENESDWPGVGVIRVFGWMTQDRQHFWSQRETNQGSVVFVGDSLIGGWKTLKNDFAPLRVANVGVGGDVSRGILFRLQEDVIALKPRAVVILTGTNDVSANEDLSLFSSNMTAILQALRNYNRFMPIVLCNLPPHDDAPYFAPARVLDLNARLAGFARSHPNVTLLDLHRRLALPDGSPDPENFEPDRIHMSPAGYQKFHDALVPVFHRLKLD